MGFEVKVIADSITAAGARITSMQLRYPRFILAELNTHRQTSKSTSSSRAIPVEKMIRQVLEDPAMPVHWGANQPGMQASKEVSDTRAAEALWRAAAEDAARFAKTMNDMGLHKQVVNRILEPFQWANTIITSTHWDNFFSLRCHPDAQPEIQKLAKMMREALSESTPVERNLYDDVPWHLPYISDLERNSETCSNLVRMSAARCARVSYNLHDGSAANKEKDIELFNKLVKSDPIHASPLEHVARPALGATVRSRNFIGWQQLREVWEEDIGARLELNRE